MRKASLAVLVTLAFLAVAFMGTTSLAQKTKSGDVPDTFKISDPLFQKKTKAEVEFTHLKHTTDHKVKCEECHHAIQGGKNTWKEGDKVAKCASCHTFEKGKKDNMLGLQDAFHANCRDCHKKEKKGPQKCNECHK